MLSNDENRIDDLATRDNRKTREGENLAIIEAELFQIIWKHHKNLNRATNAATTPSCDHL